MSKKAKVRNPDWIKWADKLYAVDRTLDGLRRRGPVMGEKWYQESIDTNTTRKLELLANEPEQFI